MVNLVNNSSFVCIEHWFIYGGVNIQMNLTVNFWIVSVKYILVYYQCSSFLIYYKEMIAISNILTVDHPIGFYFYFILTLSFIVTKTKVDRLLSSFNLSGSSTILLILFLSQRDILVFCFAAWIYLLIFFYTFLILWCARVAIRRQEKHRTWHYIQFEVHESIKFAEI